MTTVHLLTPTTRPGDAVTHDVLGMRRWLRGQGLRVHAYAENRHRSLRPLVRPLRDYQEHLGNRDDVVIYHHSVGWPAGLALYRRAVNRRVVKYHNVTPAEFYSSYDLGFAEMCRQGMRETRSLVQVGAEVWLADSAFNARELVALGADPRRCRTVPPFHRLARDGPSARDDRLQEQLQRQTTWLFVGRLAPNKGHLHLVRALAYYRDWLGGDAHLVLAGGFHPPLRGYWEELDREILRCRLADRVHLTGRVSTRRLRTYYQCARAFVCASEHEGFCVPLVEAMYHRIPVVAYGNGAVAETLGEAGLVWPTPSPALFAESFRQLETDPAVRAAVVDAQWERYQSCYTTRAIGQRLDEALAPVLEGAGACLGSTL